ncbi:hypothetical protein Scep_027084 [Stephania cephalantha]|uniref:Late embryogenesis abundant protein At5g17165-like n=1 Tax=Stephania cephalantha TaxID=152367 RepID=A0AAP0ENX8_9MAGN
MAANSQSGRGIASLGRRFVSQIWTGRNPSPASFSPVSGLSRKGVHTSVYDKNIDEQVCPSVVPDDVIEPESDKYWAPHPQTGVFGPASDPNNAAPASTSNRNGGETVLEQKAWFRPLEDVEKQPYQ